MANKYIVDGVLGKIKRIMSIEQFDDTKILIDTDHKFHAEVTWKYVLILVSCVIKDAVSTCTEAMQFSKSCMHGSFLPFTAMCLFCLVCI